MFLIGVLEPVGPGHYTECAVLKCPGSELEADSELGQSVRPQPHFPHVSEDGFYMLYETL